MSSTGSFSGRGVTPIRLAIALAVLLALFVFRDVWLPVGVPAAPSTPQITHSIEHTESKEQINHDDTVETPTRPLTTACSDVPGAHNVMVLLKTGATELYQKLPTHFVTTFKCVPNFMIFSDLEQSFADYSVYDAIKPVSTAFRDRHEDFELYRKLQKYQAEGQDMSKLSGDGGWNLDKWKFLPMMHQAFESAPENIEWYLIMEADTSVSWTNLLQWLKTMDSKKPFYMGAQNVIGDTTFAHGGSGIVISRRAADMLEEKRQKDGKAAYDERWEQVTSASCCGDEVIARALLEAGVSMQPAWPLIQGETVASLDWTDNHWCTPAITWHHVKPIEIDAMWHFEQDWVKENGWATPFLFRDVFAHFIDRHVSVNRTKWNNLSNDRKFASEDIANGDDENHGNLDDYEKEAVDSEEACAAACARKSEYECVQWMWSPGRCHLGKDIRFGKSDERGEDHWTSGWNQDRLAKFKRRFEGCKVKWSG